MGKYSSPKKTRNKNKKPKNGEGGGFKIQDDPPKTTSFTPSIKWSWRNWGDVIGLVILSATCTSVGRYSRLRTPSWINCWIKCMWISICLVLWCLIRILEMWMVLWLSHQRVIGFSYGNPNSINNCRSYRTSWLARMETRYLASTEDNAIADYFLQD